MSEPDRMEATPPIGVTWHEFANLFPMLEGDALDALRQDIAANGVREPVVFLGGAILDGRNRYMCARDLGIEYSRREFGSQASDGTDPLAFVISHNLTRRHLTESQRASAAARLANMKRGDNQHSGGSANLRTQTSAADAARMLNISPRSVESARRVHAHGSPELVAAVDAGTVAVSAAAALVALSSEDQAAVVASGNVRDAVKTIRAEKAGKSPEHGTSTRRPPPDLAGRSPDDYNRAMHFEGKLALYLESLREYDSAEIAGLLSDRERFRVGKLIHDIQAIHCRIAAEIMVAHLSRTE